MVRHRSIGGSDARCCLDSLWAGPMLQRSALFKGTELPLPDAPHQQDHRIGPSNVLVHAIRERALSYLGNGILDTHDVGRLPEIVHVHLAGEYSLGQVVHGGRSPRPPTPTVD